MATRRKFQRGEQFIKAHSIHSRYFENTPEIRPQRKLALNVSDRNSKTTFHVQLPPYYKPNVASEFQFEVLHVMIE